jgi:serine phosphatase RsbU (regulator of sigma subunit)
MKSILTYFFSILFVLCSVISPCQNINDTVGIAEGFLKQSNDYLKQNNLTEAENCLKKALALYQASGNKNALKNTYFLLSKLQEKKKDFVQAYTYYEFYANLKDTLLYEQSNKQLVEMSAKYESEKKEKDIELLTKDQELQNAQLNKQRFIRNGFIIGLSITLLLAFLLYRRYIIKQKLNIALSNKNDELTDKNLLIENQNEKIIDSINYAQHIQKSILMDENEIQKILPHSFIYFQPKDIVSGDFYWCSKINELILIAAIDCTGHGVHGAFMSMIGNTLLNQIVNEKHITKPSEILEHLHKAVFDALNQQKNGALLNDGMDMAICTIDYENNLVQFAGAKNPLYIIAGDTVEAIEADRNSLGGKIIQKNKNLPNAKFTNHIVQIKKGTSLFLFTDGYSDQFGGHEKKKFGSQRFKELLLKNRTLPMTEQKKLLIAAHEKWKDTSPQIDDILVIGIQL